MPKGIYERKPKQSKYKLKDKLICGNCYYVWKYEGTLSVISCPICGKKTDTRDKAEYSKQYALLHPERKPRLVEWYQQNKVKHSQDTTTKLRRRVFAIISRSIKPHCVSCGCDDLRLLEVNHKNGSGGQEMQKGKRSMQFYRDISMLRRETDDLELLCRVCNAKHYLEMKYGNIPMEIIWTGQK